MRINLNVPSVNPSRTVYHLEIAGQGGRQERWEDNESLIRGTGPNILSRVAREGGSRASTLQLAVRLVQWDVVAFPVPVSPDA